MAPALDHKNPVASYPRLVKFLSTYDSGPTDGGRDCSLCPHCGAKGRYTHFFLTEDGQRVGAMSGCLKLFPVSPVAKEDMRLREKAQDYAKKGWSLNSWDTKIREAIDAFYAGEVDEKTADQIIRTQKASYQSWRKNRRR